MHMEIGIPIIIVALIVVIVGYAIFWFSALRLGKRAIDRLPGPAKQAQAPNVDTKACPTMHGDDQTGSEDLPLLSIRVSRVTAGFGH